MNQSKRLAGAQPVLLSVTFVNSPTTTSSASGNAIGRSPPIGTRETSRPEAVDSWCSEIKHNRKPDNHTRNRNNNRGDVQRNNLGVEAVNDVAWKPVKIASCAHSNLIED